MKYTFSNTARSERHFSAMLLPHLLLSNDHAGMRALFGSIGPFKGVNLDSDDIEYVAELNPIRDLGESLTDFEVKPSISDLFLRIGKYALVIEMKFFTFPTGAKIFEQMAAQREVIQSVMTRFCYDDCSFHYLALTSHEINDFPKSDADMSHKTWREVISVLEPVVMTANSPDGNQVLEHLKLAVIRSEQERRGGVEQGRCKTIQELLRRAPELLEDGYRYVGYQGGKQKLSEAIIETLETRDHYKYSSVQPGNGNWLPMDEVISHYLRLKALD